MKKKLLLAAMLIPFLTKVSAQIRTNGTLIPPSVAGENIYLGDNSAGGTNQAKLEVRGDQAFTTFGWSSAIRIVPQNPGSTVKSGGALIWDRGTGTDAAPNNFFITGPANSANDNLYFGTATAYNVAPIYSSRILGRVTNGNPVGTHQFFQNVIVHDGASPSVNRVGIGTTTPTEKLHLHEGALFITGMNHLGGPMVVLGGGTPSNPNGEWGMEYVPSTSGNPGLNFWKPWPAANNGNYFLFLADNGNVGIGTNAPSTRFHTLGGVRFEGLTTGGSGTLDMVVADAAGVLFRKAIPSGSLVSSSCSTVNQVPKMGSANSLVCSQIIDNGTGVGVNMNPGVWISGGSAVLGTPPTNTNVKLDVNGMVRCTYLVVTSDERLKRNIQTIDSPLEKILKLRGVTYSWKENNSYNRALDASQQIGFIAQEVEKIIPEAVGKDENGVYGMNYVALIPVLTEALKEQNKVITVLKSQVEALSKSSTNTANDTKTNPISNGINGIELLQNKPNPFSDGTIIPCILPEGSAKATLYIFDMQGKLLKQKEIFERGNVEIAISGNELNEGMYLYGLIVDGKEISAKRMIVSK